MIVIATGTTAGPVSVKGLVPLGKGKKASLDAGTQDLGPGLLGRFELALTKRVKARLAKLSRKKSLTLTATVTGTSVSGAVLTRTLKIKLKGRAKPS